MAFDQIFIFPKIVKHASVFRNEFGLSFLVTFKCNIQQVLQTFYKYTNTVSVTYILHLYHTTYNKICPNLSKPVKTCQNLSKLVQTCHLDKAINPKVNQTTKVEACLKAARV